MSPIVPTSAEELAEALQQAASKSQTITAVGKNSKRLMAGPVAPSDLVISTTGLRRVLQYERSDLTISVEAGLPFSELQALLAQQGQMLALDPPLSAQATVGGVVASNSSGPMRRGFGTARDLVIGMSFATLDGKLVKTGGMVVKNVAGLDMGKLMIGSFGTLAVMTSVNFRIHSLPPATRSFLFTFAELDSAIQKCAAIVGSVLQPACVDLISPPAAARLGIRGYVLAVRAGGSESILQRYSRDLGGAEELSGQQETAFWQSIREFAPDFLRRHPGGIVLCVSSAPREVGIVMKAVSGTCIARAASGVTYVYFTSWQGVPGLWSAAAERGWSAVVQFAPDEIRGTKDIWLQRSSAPSAHTFAIMERVKRMFDPQQLLNRSRLYGRI